MTPRVRAGRGAFTLVELLIVIAIVGVLAATISGVLGVASKRGKVAKCAGNLRQLTAATMLYAADNDAALPLTGDAPYASPPWYNPVASYVGSGMKTGSTIALDPGKASANKIFQCPGYTGAVVREVSYAPSVTWTNNRINRISRMSRKIWLVTSTDSYSVNSSGLQRFNFPYSGDKAQVAFFDGHTELLSRAELTALGSAPFTTTD